MARLEREAVGGRALGRRDREAVQTAVAAVSLVESS